MRTIDTDKQTISLELSRIHATVDYDEDGQPALVIGEGTTDVELAGADLVETLAGARRIAEELWLFIQAVRTRQLAEERQVRQATTDLEDGVLSDHAVT